MIGTLKKEIINTFPPAKVSFEYSNSEWKNWQDIPNEFVMKDEFFIDDLSEKELLSYIPRLMLFALDDLEYDLTDSNVITFFIYKLLYCKEYNCLIYDDLQKNSVVKLFIQKITQEYIYRSCLEDFSNLKKEWIKKGIWSHPFK